MPYYRTARGGKVYPPARKYVPYIEVPAPSQDELRKLFPNCQVSPDLELTFKTEFLKLDDDALSYKFRKADSEAFRFQRGYYACNEKNYLAFLEQTLKANTADSIIQDRKKLKELDAAKTSIIEPDPAPVEVVKPSMDTNPDVEKQSIDTRAHTETKTHDNTISERTRSNKKKKKTAKNITENAATTSISPSHATTNTEVPEKVTVATPIADDVTTATPPMESPVKEPEPAKPQLKVLLRGMPIDTDISDITDHLAKINIRPNKIIQLKRRRDNDDYKPLPLFLIILLNTAANLGIYDVTHFKEKPIRVERFRGGKHQVQCFRCQGFGHTQRSCQNEPRCVKCAGGHLTHDCTKPRSTPARCCNCNSAHTANFSGCPARPRKVKRPASRQPATSTDKLTTIMKELKLLIRDPAMKEILKALLLN